MTGICLKPLPRPCVKLQGPALLRKQLLHVAYVVATHPLIASAMFAVLASITTIPIRFLNSDDSNNYLWETGWIDTTLAFFGRCTAPVSVFAQVRAPKTDALPAGDCGTQRPVST